MKRRLVGHVALLTFVLAIGLSPFALGAALRRAGFAAHYRPGVMEAVSRARGLPLVDCMIASGQEPIGRWLTVSSTRARRRCRVTDVCRPRDCTTIKRRRIVVELDFRSAQALCGIATFGQAPPSACPVEVWR